MGALPEIHMPDDAHLPRESAVDLPPIPEGQSGEFAVLHRVLPAGAPLDYFKEKVTWEHDKTFTILHHLNATWMSDTPQEITAMQLAATAARGDVLVTGLGLGIFQRSVPEAVRSVTTLEINPDVVRLVWRHITANDKRQRLVLGKAEDTMSEMIRAGREFDFIYLDTWDSGDYEQLPWVNWYVRKAYELLRDGGEVHAWSYEEMIRNFVRDCIEMRSTLKRHSDKATDEKREGMRNMWPLVGQFIDWFLDTEVEDDWPDVAACRAWCEHLARTYTDSPGYMMLLSARRQNAQEARDLQDAMERDPVKAALSYGAYVERKLRRDDDPGAMICKL